MRRDRPNFVLEEYDLLVIGGGINGAAVANIAAGHGLKVALIEKKDFASGASGNSTKLVHGGLRYLEHLELDLVRESLKERFIQVKNVGHLVKPLAFVIPVYKKDPRPLWMMKLGVFIYDILSGRWCLEKHQGLKKQGVMQFFPGLEQKGLTGGVMYYDAQMDDSRVCLENILSARQKGAHVANYVRAVSFLKEKEKVVGVKAEDTLTGETFEIRARRVVCAAGPWTNELLLLENPKAKKKVRVTKGIHIVYPQKISDKALFLQVRKDKRMFFVIPWQGRSLVGTTDTDYDGDLDNVTADVEDIRYLEEELKRVFPNGTFRKEDEVMTFAGLRPLVYRQGNPSKLSRNHVIEEGAGGVVYVMGGKYTTYRKIAEDCLKKVYRNKQFNSEMDYPLYGSGAVQEDLSAVARRYGVGQDTVEYLAGKYGTRYKDVLHLIDLGPLLRDKICSCSPKFLMP